VTAGIYHNAAAPLRAHVCLHATGVRQGHAWRGGSPAVKDSSIAQHDAGFVEGCVAKSELLRRHLCGAARLTCSAVSACLLSPYKRRMFLTTGVPGGTVRRACPTLGWYPAGGWRRCGAVLQTSQRLRHLTRARGQRASHAQHHCTATSPFFSAAGGVARHSKPLTFRGNTCAASAAGIGAVTPHAYSFRRKFAACMPAPATPAGKGRVVRWRRLLRCSCGAWASYKLRALRLSSAHEKA